jgi:hypothetical protein
MPIRPQPIQPLRRPVRARGILHTSDAGEKLKSFSDIEHEHARETEQHLSSKRKREQKGPSVAGGTRAERPRSGRSGSASNAGRKTRGH